MNQNNQMKEVQPKQSKFRQIIGNIAFIITLIVCLFVVLFCSMGNNRKMETASADDNLYYTYTFSLDISGSSYYFGDFPVTVASTYLIKVYSTGFDGYFTLGLNHSSGYDQFTFIDDNSYMYYVNNAYSSLAHLHVHDYIGFLSFNLYIIPGEYDPSVGVPLVLQVSDVWGQIAEWFAGCFPDITQFFYVDGSLTFAGTCAVIMAGVALILLIFNLIRSFLPMRG